MENGWMRKGPHQLVAHFHLIIRHGMIFEGGSIIIHNTVLWLLGVVPPQGTTVGTHPLQHGDDSTPPDSHINSQTRSQCEMLCIQSNVINV